MTNDGTLVVNFAALQAASGDISRAISALGSELDDLELKARPLVATWQGSAQEAYAVRQARWKQAAGDLATVLHQIRLRSICRRSSATRGSSLGELIPVRSAVLARASPLARARFVPARFAALPARRWRRCLGRLVRPCCCCRWGAIVGGGPGAAPSHPVRRLQ